MQRPGAALLLLLSACGVAHPKSVFSPEDVTRYSRLLLNPCTACHVTNTLRNNDDVLKEVSSHTLSAASKLPPAFVPYISKALERFSTDLHKEPRKDCAELCKAVKSTSPSCDWFLQLHRRVSGFLQSLADDISKKCGSAATCHEQHKTTTTMVISTVEDLMHGLASTIDSKAACDLKAPSTTQAFALSNLYTNSQFLNCQLCFSLLQFLNTAVASGQTHTSQAILADIGVAAKNVCVIIDLPALLHLLVPGLGDLDCDGMPQIIEMVFEYVLSPMFGAQAQETCTKLFDYCGDVFNP